MCFLKIKIKPSRCRCCAYLCSYAAVACSIKSIAIRLLSSSRTVRALYASLNCDRCTSKLSISFLRRPFSVNTLLNLTVFYDDCATKSNDRERETKTYRQKRKRLLSFAHVYYLTFSIEPFE